MDSGSGLGEWGFSGLPSQEERPLPASLPGPQRVGSWELIEQIGEGGMGAIWRARGPQAAPRPHGPPPQGAAGGEVAIKLMLRARTATLRQRERFMNEALAATRLDHPHIVKVHGVGEEAGIPYLVMDLVAGESASDRLKRAGPFDPREAVQITARLARALEHAHARRVLHRDIKPGNVLLDRSGQPRLTDFGLAKLLDSSRDSLTRSGDVLGTPGYMAPEQVYGKADERSDVYALAATLYALLTGGPPTTARTVLEFLTQLQQVSAPALRAARPDVDERLDRIVAAGLRRDLQERYTSAGELAEDLERWLDGLSPIAPAARGAPPRAAPAARGLLVATCLLLLATGGLVWALSRPVQPDPEAVLAVARGHTQAGRPAAALAALDSALAVSPDQPALRHERARLLLDQGEPGRALEDVRAALASTPDDPNLVYMLACARAALGRRQEALESCQRAVQLDPRQGQAWLLLAGLSHQAGDSANALAAAEQAVALHARGAQALRAQLRLRLGQRAEALSDMQAAVAEEPHRPDLWRNLAALRQSSGDLPGAVEACTRALELEPRDPRAWLARARARLAARAPGEALLDCNHALELAPDDLDGLDLRAQVRTALHDVPGAIADYSRLIELSPRLAHAWSNRATLRMDRGDLDGALADLKQAEAIEPQNPLFPTSEAAVLERRSDWPGMITLLDPVLASQPDFPPALFARATARGRLGLWDDARQDLDRLLARNPRHVDGLIARANVELAQQRYRAALPDLDRLLQLQPEHLDGLALRGVAHAYLGERDTAIEDLRHYLRRAPPDHWRRADVQRSLGYLEQGR